nr:uncharacterized protein LOC113804707 [Penaeus vannamei]
MISRLDLDPGDESGERNVMNYEHHKNSRRRDSDIEDYPYSKQSRTRKNRQTIHGTSYTSISNSRCGSLPNRKVLHPQTYQNLPKKNQINEDHIKERIEKKKDPGDIDYSEI